MANKRPVVIDTATGTLKELKPPDQLPTDILPTTSGSSTSRAFFLS